MAVFAAATFVVRIVTAQLARRHGEPAVLVGAIFCAAAGYAAFPLANGAVALAAISFVIGLGCGCGQPITMTLIYNLSPKGRAAEGTGIRVMINQLTHVVIPITFGAMASAAGYVAVFAGCAAMLFGGGECCRRSAARGARAPQDRDPGSPGPGGGTG
ncbi:MAG: MFS transporter [bacterium]